jgi:hypothetical protein
MSPQSQPDAHSPPEPEPSNEAESVLPRYASFVLRCQITAGGGILARLSEVSSGLCYSVTDLDELPSLVRRRMADQAEV